MKSSRGRSAVRWAIAAAVAALLGLIGAQAPNAPSAASPPRSSLPVNAFTASAIDVRDGTPLLLVDGRPFYFFGAAFFYERIPATRWRAAMLALQRLGFNTLDLYIPWNWHELADGDFDFDGHTNPRRNLRGVLALARKLGFKLIVRPGPVIRNEWRNGGYPAWLLTRPEYGMPLHDVLEGRYPATATLQNANSDDAAAQWLANGTHLRYATRWLQTALRELLPVADRVIAVQLDDDQGAYIDNQTWPAPRLQAYLQTLEATVRSVVGAQLPVFINTYEMKVTASAPVWAMGNWYQSDAYSIGEHDRTSLEFSAGLLQTQPRYPLAMSEFQAGWLAPPEDPQPRPADPTNTTLALHTLLAMGMRGAIDFPAQDTVNPAGWEAPFANASYAWDAALDAGLQPSARYAPTKRFGELVRANGAELATARRYADGAIAWLPSAYDPARITNADVFALVARTQAAQQACRARHLACDLIDLRFAAAADLARYPFLIVPGDAISLPFVEPIARRLTRYRVGGGRIAAAPPDVVTPHAGGIADAALLIARDGTAFLDVVNYDFTRHAIPATRLTLPDGRIWKVAAFAVAPRDAVLLRNDPAGARNARGTSAPVARNAQPKTQRDELGGTAGRVQASPVPCQTAFPFVLGHVRPFGPARLIVDDRAADGYPRTTLTNDHIAMTLAPAAGARAFSLTATLDGCTQVNAFTSVGALRDDVAIQPPLSTTDRIGKYTRSFPAGTFNRVYRFAPAEAPAHMAALGVDADVADVVPAGAHFARTLLLGDADDAVEVRERVRFAGGIAAAPQRAVRYDSFDTRGATTLDERADGAIGFFFPAAGYVTIVTWSSGDVETAALIAERTSTVVQLRFAPDRETRTRYAVARAADLAGARAALAKERAALSTPP
jgi:hypothetical protein